MKDFLAGFSMTGPINILLAVTEAGRDSCKRPFKTTKEDEAEMQEVTVCQLMLTRLAWMLR